MIVNKQCIHLCSSMCHIYFASRLSGVTATKLFMDMLKAEFSLVGHPFRCLTAVVSSGVFYIVKMALEPC